VLILVWHHCRLRRSGVLKIFSSYYYNLSDDLKRIRTLELSLLLYMQLKDVSKAHSAVTSVEMGALEPLVSMNFINQDYWRTELLLKSNFCFQLKQEDKRIKAIKLMRWIKPFILRRLTISKSPFGSFREDNLMVKYSTWLAAQEEFTEVSEDLLSKKSQCSSDIHIWGWKGIIS